MRRRFASVVIMLLASSVAGLADVLPRSAILKIDEIWSDPNAPASGDIPDLVGTDLIAAYISDRFIEDEREARSFATIRNDLHPGTLSSAAGSTSVVTRPGATDLVSLALESGAVTRTADNQAVTFGVNTLPAYQLMTGRKPLGCGSLDDDCVKGPTRWIRGLSLSATFSNSGSTVPVPVDVGATLAGAAGVAAFLSSSKTIQAIGGRYEFFVRERDDARAQTRLSEAARALSSKVGSFLTNEATFETELGNVLKQWRVDTLQLLRATNSRKEMSEVLLKQYRKAYELAANVPKLRQAADAAREEKIRYMSAQNALLAEKLYRKALTVDYVNARPSNQPSTHQLRLVLSTPLGRKPGRDQIGASAGDAEPPGMLTFNSGVTVYGDDADGRSHRVRDAQVSGAIDWSPTSWGAVRPTYTVAYYFQYMVENGLIKFSGDAITPGGAAIRLSSPAIEILGTKGAIHITQFRVLIPFGASGVSFPGAVSYASRGELAAVNRPLWKGQFGVSYDFSSLKSFLRRPPSQ